MLPIGGVLIALFMGWVLDKKIFDEQLAEMSEGLRNTLRFLVRIVAPVAVFVVFLMTVVFS